TEKSCIRFGRPSAFRPGNCGSLIPIWVDQRRSALECWLPEAVVGFQTWKAALRDQNNLNSGSRTRLCRRSKTSQSAPECSGSLLDTVTQPARGQERWSTNSACLFGSLVRWATFEI